MKFPAFSKRNGLCAVVLIVIMVALVFFNHSGETNVVQAQQQPTVEQPVTWQRGVVLGSGDVTHFQNCVVTGFDFTKVITVGESSFIPIGMTGLPENNPKLILDIVNEFRERIYSLRATWRIQINSYNGEISGIWVEHNTIFPELIKDTKFGE